MRLSLDYSGTLPQKTKLGGYAKASRAKLEINVLPGMSLLKLCLFNTYPASS